MQLVKFLKKPGMRLAIAGCAGAMFGLAVCYQGIALQNRQYLYADVAETPFRPVAMLLGTAPTVQGLPNAYFTHRIDAVAALWRAHKFDSLILSGSRRMTRKGLYDEISAMRQALSARGLPAEIFHEDPQAHRTRLSILNAKSRFGLKDYLLISQGFHCERALYIAHELGQSPICFAAEDVPAQPLMWAREVLSRGLAVAEALWPKARS